MSEHDPTDFTLESLKLCCRKEQGNHTSRAICRCCFELAHRALDNGNDDAFTAFHGLFLRQVYSWTTTYRVKREVADELVQEAFARMWRAYGPSSAKSIKRDFSSIGHVLKTLRLCLYGAFIDWKRRVGREPVREKTPGEPDQRRKASLMDINGRSAASDIDGHRLAAIAPSIATDLWEWFHLNVLDPKERTAMELRHLRGYTPVEIAEAHPELFSDVRDVYGCLNRTRKRTLRALERIKKDKEQEETEAQMKKDGKKKNDDANPQGRIPTN